MRHFAYKMVALETLPGFRLANAERSDRPFRYQNRRFSTQNAPLAARIYISFSMLSRSDPDQQTWGA